MILVPMEEVGIGKGFFFFKTGELVGGEGAFTVGETSCVRKLARPACTPYVGATILRDGAGA